MRYDAILFDLDNTLYDYNAYWRQRLLWSLEPVQQRYTHLDIDDLANQAMAQHIYFQEWRNFLAQAGIADEAIMAETLARYHVNTYEQLALYADAAEVLRHLRQHCKLGLITNGPAHTQRPKIVQFDLEAMMDVIVVSEEVGIAKPDPAIFHLALQQLGVSPERALFVGDSLEHDLKGASAAGIDFIWMNPEGLKLPAGLPACTAIIVRLEELQQLLEWE